MKATDAIKQLMEEKKMSNAYLANMVGVSSQTMWDRISGRNSKHPAVDKMVELLKIFDYEMVFVPRGKASRIDGAFIIEMSEEPKKGNGRKKEAVNGTEENR